MLVNPSIYNNTGKYTSNYDLLTLEKRTGVANAKPKNTLGYPYKNSLTEQINQAKYETIRQFSTNFRADISTVLSTVKLLSNKKSAVYDDRKAVEKSKAFDVKANEGATLGKQTLKVSQLATAQVNTASLKPKNAIFDDDFSGKLDISKNGKTKSIDFTLKKGETHEDGYLRLSKAINQGNAGVSAEVKTDDMGYTTLKITSKETGKDAGFKLSGTLADELNLNSSEKEGTNMVYELNGKDGESTTNDLKLDDGKIEIQVKATNGEADSFDVQASSKALVDTLKDFATAMNQFTENQRDSDNPAMQSILRQMTNTVKASLDKMDLKGIQMDKNGQLTIDETQLNEALENDVEGIKDKLTDFDSFAANMTRKSEQLLKFPLGELVPRTNSDGENKTLGSSLKAYMYNYSAQSIITNINQLNGTGSVMDIRI